MDLAHLLSRPHNLRSKKQNKNAHSLSYAESTKWHPQRCKWEHMGAMQWE